MNHHGAECQECQFFVHARKNGRITRKTFGACTYVVDWPKAIPMNYNWSVPSTQKVWATSNAEGCQCFRAIDK